MGPYGKPCFYWQTIGRPALWSPPETFAYLRFANSAPSLAQIGNSACIAVQSQGNALNFYSQTIGTSFWHPELVAGKNTTFSRRR